MKYPNLLSGGLLAVATTACFSPQPILQLQPTSGPSSWFYGKEVLTRQYDSLRVFMISDRWVGDELIFAVEIINRFERYGTGGSRNVLLRSLLRGYLGAE